MVEGKIQLDAWVYKCLEAHGNCALPKECETMDLEELEKHLSKKMKTKIKIRKAYLNSERTDCTLTKQRKVIEYLIAEEKR